MAKGLTELRNVETPKSEIFTTPDLGARGEASPDPSLFCGPLREEGEASGLGRGGLYTACWNARANCCTNGLLRRIFGQEVTT